MIAEPSWSEIAILWTINAVCSMVCSQIHKCLYFLLGLNYWAMHFGHYFLTFLVLLVISLTGTIFQRQPIPAKVLVPLVLSEFLTSAGSCIVHTGGSDGTVYTIRVTDFAVTLVVILSAKYFIDEKYYSFSGSPNLLLLVNCF